MNEQAPTPPEHLLVSDEKRTYDLVIALSRALERHLGETVDILPADVLMGILNFTRTALIWSSIHAHLYGRERKILFSVALTYLAEALEREHKRLTEEVDPQHKSN